MTVTYEFDLTFYLLLKLQKQSRNHHLLNLQSPYSTVNWLTIWVQ